MRVYKLIAMIALALCFFTPRPAASSPQPDRAADEKAIQDVETRWQDAWNRHDISALADLLTDDADFITVIGKWCKGKKEFYDYHVRLHQVMFKDSIHKTTGVQVRFLSPQVAIVHVNWTITGDRNADGTPRPVSRSGIFTRVMVKQDGPWLITASQNTNILPDPVI